jgi:hypothetical protein
VCTEPSRGWTLPIDHAIPRDVEPPVNTPGTTPGSARLGSSPGFPFVCGSRRSGRSSHWQTKGGVPVCACGNRTQRCPSVALRDPASGAPTSAHRAGICDATLEGVLVELDGRLQVSLGELGLAAHSPYLVTKEADGRLIFTPATELLDDEVHFLANTDLRQRIATNREDPSRMIRRPRG